MWSTLIGAVAVRHPARCQSSAYFCTFFSFEPPHPHRIASPRAFDGPAKATRLVIVCHCTLPRASPGETAKIRPRPPYPTARAMLRAASRIGAGGALAGTGWYFYSQYQLQNEPVPDFAKQGLRVLELTPFESNPAFFDQAQPVSAVTFFEGKPPTGFLAQRVAEIVRANPWLAARHVRIKGTHAFTYDDGTAVYPECFAVAGADAGLHRGLTFRQTLATLDALAKEEKGLGLLPAQGAQPPGSPQFRVTLVPDSKAPNERFALVTTMSHILGDGHTFYAIHNQLSKRAKPAPLSPARKLDALAQIKEKLGGEGGMHAGGLFESPAFSSTTSWLMIRLPLAARVLSRFRARSSTRSSSARPVAGKRRPRGRVRASPR